MTPKPKPPRISYAMALIIGVPVVIWLCAQPNGHPGSVGASASAVALRAMADKSVAADSS